MRLKHVRGARGVGRGPSPWATSSRVWSAVGKAMFQLPSRPDHVANAEAAVGVVTLNHV